MNDMVIDVANIKRLIGAEADAVGIAKAARGVEQRFDLGSACEGAEQEEAKGGAC